MARSLALQVFLSTYKPIPSGVPDWPEGEQATWPASTATLIVGSEDCVLVDALMTTEESVALAKWVRATGKTLTHIYVTHGHADHFFGLTGLLAEFPEALPVTLPSVLPEAEAQLSAGLMGFWNSLFPGQLPVSPVLPAAWTGTELVLDGHLLRIADVGQSDLHASTVVHVPELATVISGDVAYNRMHLWMAGSDHDSRTAWLAALDRIEAMGPARIITGHKDPAAPDDNAVRILDETRQYINDYDAAVSTSGTAAELVAKVMRLHGDQGNPYTLWVAAAQDQSFG